MIKNLTPHIISLVDDEGVRVFLPEGLVRLKETRVDAGFMVDGCKITKTIFSEPVGLPEFDPDTYYIVSQPVKSALPMRSDLLVPDDLIRNDKGEIIGCKSFKI